MPVCVYLHVCRQWEYTLRVCICVFVCLCAYNVSRGVWLCAHVFHCLTLSWATEQYCAAGAILKPLYLSKQLILCSQQHIDQLFTGHSGVNYVFLQRGMLIAHYMCTTLAHYMCSTLAHYMCSTLAHYMCTTLAHYMCTTLVHYMCTTLAHYMCTTLAH